MTRVTAFLDANILYPAPLRDIFLQLAVRDVFRAKWSSDIHREWIDALLRNEPHRSRAALERTRGLMDQATRDCLVTGYETLNLRTQPSRLRRPSCSRRGDHGSLRCDRHLPPCGAKGRQWHEEEFDGSRRVEYNDSARAPTQAQVALREARGGDGEAPAELAMRLSIMPLVTVLMLMWIIRRELGTDAFG